MFNLLATFRITTPMFCGGATQQAELRVPAIKGAIRFWWRALAWARMEHPDQIESLRHAEAALFGSAEGGCSNVLLSIKPSKILKETPPAWKIKDPENGWKCYSGYGVHEGLRSCISAEQEFTVAITLRERNTQHISELTQAFRALGLVGGLGSRSRNGWGSLTLVEMDGWKCPKSPHELEQHLRRLILADAPLAPYSAFTSQTRWEIGPPQGSPEKAHKWIVRKYQEIKRDPQVQKLDRVELGLPRALRGVRYPHLDERRASPLLLHVHQPREGTATPLAIWLPSSQWLENEAAPPGSAGNAAKAFLDSIRAG